MGALLERATPIFEIALVPRSPATSVGAAQDRTQESERKIILDGTYLQVWNLPRVRAKLGLVDGSNLPVAGLTGQQLVKLSDADYDVGWSSDPAAGITELTGDVTAGPGSGSQAATIANSAVTTAKIANFAVTNAKLALMPATTIKGNQFLLSSFASDLTGTQVTAMLDVFSSFFKGLAPPTGGSTTTRFLRDDQTWAVPPDTEGITELTGDVTAGPGSGSQTATIADNTVSNAKLRDSFPLSVIGRSANSTGDPADIDTTAGSSEVLRESGGVLGFGTVVAAGIANDAITTLKIANDAVTSGKIANDAVTFAKMQDISTDRLLGRGTAGTGDVEEIVVGGGLEFGAGTYIQRSALTGDVTASAGGNSTNIANDAVTTAKIANDTVTFAKMQNVNTDKLLGRDTAGTGDVEEIAIGGGLEFTGATGIQTSAFTGDVTKAAGGTALTIAADAVTNAKLADMAANSIKGNNTGGAANPIDLTTAQATAMLDPFTSLLKGLVPASGGGTANFLRADGTFATPPGTGINQLTGDVTAGPGSGSQAATIAADAVTFAKMQNIATDSLIGRDTAGTGDPETILLNATLAMDGSGNLQRAALTGDVTALAGSNATTIANNAVTDAKLRDSAGFSVIGKATTGTGDPADIVAADETILGRTAAGNLAFAQLATGQIAADAVTNAKLADMLANTVKVNATAGTANPTDLALPASTFLARLAAGNIVAATATEATALLNTFTSLLKGLVPASGGGTATFLRADGTFAAPTATPSAKQTEVDFGDVFDVNSQTFTIVDADVAATSRLDCWLSGDAPTGKDADDVIAEDPLKFIVVPSTGTFNLYVEQPVGCLNGKYKINYEINAAA
jgi:hypothetical protein